MSKYIMYNGTFREVSNVEQTPQNKLSYIDVGPNEVVHFKYVKRISLPNGGYRYYYDENAAKSDQLKNTYKAKNEMVKTGREANEASKKYYKAKKAYDDAGLNSPHNGEYTKGESSLIKKEASARKQMERAYKSAERAINKYNRLVNDEKRKQAISKGFVKVANLFSKLFSKKK